MKGYNTIRECVYDSQLYHASVNLAPHRKGETITSYLDRVILERLANSSPRFKAEMKKK